MNVPVIRVLDVLKYVETEDYRVIDVRQPGEFTGELGHVPGSKQITLGDELNAFFSQTEPSEKLIFVCRSGVRSARATELAMERGFSQVFNMKGGMLEWNAEGLGVER